MLLVGTLLCGFGNWEAMRKDPKLGLEGKFFLENAVDPSSNLVTELLAHPKGSAARTTTWPLSSPYAVWVLSRRILYFLIFSQQRGEFHCTAKAVYHITDKGHRLARWDVISKDLPNSSSTNVASAHTVSHWQEGRDPILSSLPSRSTDRPPRPQDLRVRHLYAPPTSLSIELHVTEVQTRQTFSPSLRSSHISDLIACASTRTKAPTDCSPSRWSSPRALLLRLSWGSSLSVRCLLGVFDNGMARSGKHSWAIR